MYNVHDVHPIRGLLVVLLSLIVGYAAVYAGDGAGTLTFKRNAFDVWWDAERVAQFFTMVGALLGLFCT